MEKELRSLNRRELMEIIYQLKKSEQELQQDNAALKEQLADKRIKIENAGSVADAAMALSEIFTAVQSVADRYLAEIETRRANAEKESKAIIGQARMEADVMIKKAIEQCDLMIMQAQRAQKEPKDEASGEQTEYSVNEGD